MLINGTDILATIADVVGFDLLESQAKDSHNFYPLLKSDVNFQARDDHASGWRAMSSNASPRRLEVGHAV